jgi:hypothetical protein
MARPTKMPKGATAADKSEHATRGRDVARSGRKHVSRRGLETNKRRPNELPRRVDWARLSRRSFEVDVLEYPKCRGRLRVLAVITERETVQRILGHVGMATDAPPIARA